MKIESKFLNVINFNQRKIIHYVLLVSIFIIQILLALFFYNEIFNENKLEEIERSINESEKMKSLTEEAYLNLFDAQQGFQNYLIKKEDSLLYNYTNSLKLLSNSLNSIHDYSLENPHFKGFVALKDSTTINKARLDKLIDSIGNIKLLSESKNDFVTLKVNQYNYKDVLNSVSTESYIEIDSVERKGLFLRIGNAIAGNVDVQKEKVKVIVTMKYGKKVVKGNIEEQLANAFKSSNKHFSDELSDIKEELLKNKDKENALLSRNEELILFGEDLTNIYEKAINDFQKALKEEFQKQYSNNKFIRYIAVFGLIMIMFIVSLALVYLTYYSFEYEQKLEYANKKIVSNLNFERRILAMLSHELRAPFNILSIYIKKILKTTKDESIKESLNSMLFTISSLSLQFNQILEYVKNKDKEIKLKKVDFNLKEELDNILGTLESFVTSNGNRFKAINEIKGKFILNSDKVKIHQLFLNLIGNANKFTDNGLISVKIQLLETKVNKINIEVQIEDDGLGIVREDLEKIFEPYYQGTISDEVENVGAGLGLKLCEEIVELFNGKIEVISEVNKGTKVIFNLILDKKL